MRAPDCDGWSIGVHKSGQLCRNGAVPVHIRQSVARCVRAQTRYCLDLANRQWT